VTVPFAVTKNVGDDGIVRLRVAGGIDNDVSETLTALMINAIEQDGVVGLVIDLTEARFLAAAGLRGLLDGRGAALRRGCGFQLANAQGVVERVLQVTGFADLFEPITAEDRARG
jgi:anti-anti-sigma factor